MHTEDGVVDLSASSDYYQIILISARTGEKVGGREEWGGGQVEANYSIYPGE